jgi:hypothetical protein
MLSMAAQSVVFSSHETVTCLLAASAFTALTPAISPTSRWIVITQWPQEMLGTFTVFVVMVLIPFG